YKEKHLTGFTKSSENYPCFARIDLIYEKNNEIFFALAPYKTLGYLKHYLGYKLLQEKDILHLHFKQKSIPMDLYNLDNHLIVVPKYPIK
ncbi:hypothetical protein BpHYR1_032581, partial [Brachionus plicatilis]